MDIEQKAKAELKDIEDAVVVKAEQVRAGWKKILLALAAAAVVGAVLGMAAAHFA